MAVLDVLSLRRMPWFPYRRYAGNPTFNQPNKVSPPLGHWNPETLEPRVEAPGHWNLGTLEPQVHREEKGHRPENRERAPTRGTVFLFSGTPLAVTGGLSAARFIAEPLMEVTTSWVGARWLQVKFLVSFFPRLLRGGAVPQLQWSCRVAVFKLELEGGASSSTLEKTDGGGRVREERL